MFTGVRAHDFGKNDPQTLFAQIKEAGFESMQLAIPKAIKGVDNFTEVNDKVIDKIKEALDESGLKIAVIGCYVNLAHPNRVVRETEADYFKKAILYCKKLGADMVASETTTFNPLTMELEPAYERLMESLKSIIEKARINDTMIAMEPVCCHTLHSIELVHRMLRDGKTRYLKLVFDPVNMIPITEIKRNDEIIKECLDAFGEHIETIHLKDVVIKNGAFAPAQLGTGEMKYDYLFDWLKKNKPDITVLRENCQIEVAKEENQWMRMMMGR